MKKKCVQLAFMVMLSLFVLGITKVSAAKLEMPAPAQKTVNTRDEHKAVQIAQLSFFANMTIEAYATYKGHKLNFVEKAYFKMNQKKAKRFLKKHGYYDDDLTLIQKLGSFAKGFLFGPIIIPLMYIFAKEEERAMIRWMWYGFGAAAIAVGLLLLFP
jgi:hypothetical protein